MGTVQRSYRVFSGCSELVLLPQNAVGGVLGIWCGRNSRRANSQGGNPVKTTTKMKKITVRRTGDVRLTTATCKCPYSVEA